MAKPLSVLITSTETKPSPWLAVLGTGTTSCVALTELGVSGPSLTDPVAVATKKLTMGLALKPLPLMTKLAPTSTGLVRLVITGWPGSGVGVGTGTVGLGVVITHLAGVGVGVGVAVRVGVCVRVGVVVGTS